jgi:conserved oligomeric Golgi complex subunit 6
MCEQAAEAHKSKGSLARRGRTTSSDPSGNSRDSVSVDAILSKSLSTLVLVSSILVIVKHVLDDYIIFINM